MFDSKKIDKTKYELAMPFIVSIIQNYVFRTYLIILLQIFTKILMKKKANKIIAGIKCEN